MQRISTATAVADMFGAGKDGFTDTPPNKTELDAAWHNSIQEEIARAIEDQGIALNPGSLDQLTTALNSWNFSGSPVIKNGSTLTVASGGIVAVASGGGLALNMGSIFAVQSGVTFIWDNSTIEIGDDNTNSFTSHGDNTFGTDNASTQTLKGDVNLCTDGTNTGVANGDWTVGTSSGNSHTINGDVTAADGIDTGSSAGWIAPGEVRFYSDATPSTTTGVVQFAGRYLTVGISSTAKKVAVFDEDWEAGPLNTGLALADTGAQVVLTLVTGDTVAVDMSMESSNSAGANHVRSRIEVNGSTLGGTNDFLPVAANEPVSITRRAFFTAPSDAVYTFKARHGAPDGGTTTTHNAYISVRHRH